MRTIWSKDALPLVPPHFRPIYRVLLPIVDVEFLAFSVIAVFVGSRVVSDFTLHWFPFAWAGLMGLGAVLASIGLVFELDWTEFVGKSALIAGFVIYILILTAYVGTGSSSSLLTITLNCLCVTGLAARLADIVVRRGRKDADRER